MPVMGLETSGSGPRGDRSARGARGARAHGKGLWRREAVEFAALFIAAGVAHLFATALGLHEAGAMILIGLGGALCVIVTAHLWLSHRREARPLPHHARSDVPAEPARLWRVRAQVRETPGRLAALAAATAATGGNIMSLSTQPDVDGTVDELYVQMPAPVPGEALVTALTAAGGHAVSARPATMHELVDPVARALLLASSVREAPRRLPDVLAALLGAHILPATADGHDVRDTLSLPSLTGRPIRLHRPGMPFTASETGRALAMLDHARARHPRVV
jgi:hypothetical protein